MAFRSGLIWFVLVATITIPVVFAAYSPLLAWRNPVYVLAGFAGVIAMTILLLQPLLATGLLPGLSRRMQRNGHLWLGVLLVFCVVIHVAGLWITSPPDVIDALLFTSATPFSNWGTIAMWCVFASAGLQLWRRKLQLKPSMWRGIHRLFAAIIVTASIVHAVLIEGTMEMFSKAMLCALVALATLRALVFRSR